MTSAGRQEYGSALQGLGPVRIGNCSGFYGDRLSAMHEMLTGGELDYLTGDYLAELTMLILAPRPGQDTRPRLRQDVL